MATLAELGQLSTPDLDGPVVAHLQRLVAGWGVLSDLCFADLLLFVPVEGHASASWSWARSDPPPARRSTSRTWSGGSSRPRTAPCWPGPGSSGSVVEGEVAIPSRERARPPGVHSGALAGAAGGPHDQGVGPVGWPPARTARAGLRRGLRSPGPDDLPRGVPVSRWTRW